MLRTEYIDVDFNLKLKKDLQEDEVICPKCGGTGLQVGNNPFGLKGEDSRVMFPYKHQVILGCRHCYNGVQKKCSYCGELLGRQSAHDCEGAKEERKQKRYEKELEQWEKSKKISLERAIKGYVMVYVDDYDVFVNTEELKEWIADKENESENIKSLRIYGTYTMDLSINAFNIIEDACSDLHEDAMDNISNEDQKELQTLLDQWCEDNKQGTTTYYADFKVGVEL